MPQQHQNFSYPGHDSQSLINMAYGALLHLGWTPKYAGENILIAYTPRNWKKYDDEITIEAADNSLAVTSKMIHNETFDLTGKNKKHISEFIAAFEKIKTAQTGNNAVWSEAVNQLKQQTVVAATEEAKQVEEINKVMNLSGSNLYATYAIIAINVVVFILMIIDGAGMMDTNVLVHIKWGSNFTPLTLSGDWWRLITNVFIHFGVIHIIMNTYALYMVGVYLEPMLGKTRYIAAYLCSGILASVASLWWHKETVNSAGASGAIFGLFGVFLALLFTNLIPQKMRKALLQSIGIFVVYNLVYGMKAGVDNSAHIGGLLSGLVIGFIYYLGLRKEETGNKKQIVALGIAVVTIASAFYYLDANKVGKEARTPVLNEISALSEKDGEKFIEKINAFIELEKIALEPLNDTTISNKEIAQKLNNTSAGEWDKAKALLAEMKTYTISESNKEKVGLLDEYVTERKEEIVIINQIAAEEKKEDYARLDAVREKISGLIEKISKLK